MSHKKKVFRFMINRNDGASQYDLEIDKAIVNYSNDFSYNVIEIKELKFVPRFLSLIIFWIRAQHFLFFGNIDLAILSPWMMLIYPKNVSIICVSHHYDPSVFSGIRKLYVNISHWFFLKQKSRVSLVVSCSKYWSNYYKKKGFSKTSAILNGFDIKAMDYSVLQFDNQSVLNKYNLESKEYFHLGSFGRAKGQKIALRCLKDYYLTKIATGFTNFQIKKNYHDLRLISANFNEYNILLKNAKAVICMSEFKEGWCRVLHEAAIHGTPIFGSGLGGMNELLEIGGYLPSTEDTLNEDLEIRQKEIRLPNDIVDKYREFTLERFGNAWLNHINELLKLY